MKLIDMKIAEYLELLRSDAPAPGGGSVSALAGAQGCALFMMVADLTIGKEKYADFQDDCIKAKEEGMILYKELCAGIDRDTDAFNIIADAFKMPKETEEEKEARRAAIAAGSLAATEVPFDNMKFALDGIRIAGRLIGRSNPNCSSDLGVAVINLRECVNGAWMNVKINLPSVKDEEKVKYFETEGEKIVNEAEELAQKYYDEVVNSL